jgi:hypothetical protein
MLDQSPVKNELVVPVRALPENLIDNMADASRHKWSNQKLLKQQKKELSQ